MARTTEKSRKRQMAGANKKRWRARKGATTHETKSGTRKYQCNGLKAWLPKLQALADKVAGVKNAELAIGIRAAIAKGLGAGVPGEGDVRAVDLLPGKQTRIPGTR